MARYEDDREADAELSQLGLESSPLIPESGHRAPGIPEYPPAPHRGTPPAPDMSSIIATPHRTATVHALSNCRERNQC
jgi:hypothetical protein